MAHDKLEKIEDQINELMNAYKQTVDGMSRDRDLKHVSCLVAIYLQGKSTWIKVIRE